VEGGKKEDEKVGRKKMGSRLRAHDQGRRWEGEIGKFVS
jgi:hypothetical protein